jgi:hypothetical protein
VSDEVDRDAPTPRLTAAWSLHEDHAHQLSERLRAFAAACSDVPRSKRLRDLSDVAEDYARAFRRWSLEDVPTATKMRERRAFSLFSQAADVELEP